MNDNRTDGTDQSMQELVTSLYEAADVSDEARQETAVDDDSEVAYIPPDALREVTEFILSGENTIEPLPEEMQEVDLGESL